MSRHHTRESVDLVLGFQDGASFVRLASPQHVRFVISSTMEAIESTEAGASAYLEGYMSALLSSGATSAREGGR